MSDNAKFELWIPIEPRPLMRARARAMIVRGKPVANVYDPQENKNYKQAIAKMAQAKIAQGFGEFKPLQSPLIVSIAFHVTKPKTVTRQFPKSGKDIDNYIKAVLDALNKILWQDDSWIVKLRDVEVLYAGQLGAGIYLSIEPYGQEQFAGYQKQLI